jgi:hypothetical protein
LNFTSSGAFRRWCPRKAEDSFSPLLSGNGLKWGMDGEPSKAMFLEMGSVYFLAKGSTCVMVYAFGLFDTIAKNERLLVKKATMLLDECESSIEVWIMFLPVFCVAIKKMIGTAIFILV